MQNNRLVRFFSFFACLAVVFGMLFVSQGTVLADTDTATGLVYYVSGGSATVSGFIAPSGFNGALTIPATLGGAPVTSISGSAFQSNVSLKSINIPSSVTTVSETYFDQCTNLAAINIDAAHPKYKSIDGVLYSKDGTELLCVPCARAGNYAIPSPVSDIGFYAFEDCTKLTSISIPSTVTFINEAEAYFDDCNALTAFIVDAANPYYKSIDGALFSKDGTIVICCPAAKAGSFRIPNGATTLGGYAFEDCDLLTTIIIPSSVTSVHSDSFIHSDNLAGIYFCGNAPTIYWNTTLGLDSSELIIYYLAGSTGFTNPWGGATTAIVTGGVSYRTHVQDVGWQGYVSNGALSGTSGQSKRLEAINIKLEGVSGGIEYRTHVQDIGWQGFVANNALSGTSGQSKRLEAIQVRLTGEAANLYDVYYRVHAQDTGWLDWAKNGASSGTAGYSRRLEAIEIKLVAKGGAAPGATTRPFIQNGEPIPSTGGSVLYKTHVQDVGWQAYVSDGAASGTSGQSKRLEGIQIKLNNIAGGIEYSTHIQDIGWQGFVANDAMSGTSGQSKRLEAIKIRLTGAAAEAYDVYYCVHAQDTGWLDWAKNGEAAGTAGFSYRLEAIKIVLVPKGAPAPGPTARAFVQG